MTLLIDFPAATQDYLNTIRQAHFPKHKWKDDAHLTLMYQIHLPQEIIIKRLESIEIPELNISSDGVKAFTFGTAIKIAGNELIPFQRQLKKLFQHKLSKKDLHPYKPHVTVQLDVTAFKAQKTQEQLSNELIPFATQALGISLWIKNRKEQTCIWKSYTSTP